MMTTKIKTGVFGLTPLIVGLAISASDVYAGKRIVGGSGIDISEAPYQVAIGYAGDNTFDNQFCGGSLINEKWILTAAHCFLNDDNTALVTSGDFVATVGETTLSTAKSSNQYAFTMQNNVYIHPDFVMGGENKIDHDIALIQLASSIDMEACGDNCDVIDMATASNEFALASASTPAWASGWGVTNGYIPVLIDGEYEDPEGYVAVKSDVLKEVNLAIMACGVSKTGAVRTERVICAGASDLFAEDTCQGDSGGPLVVKNNEGTGFTLVGVNSYGHGCAAGEEGAYTRVSKYQDWIATRQSNPSVSPSEVSAEGANNEPNDGENNADSDNSVSTAVKSSDGGGTIDLFLLSMIAGLSLLRVRNRA